MNKAIVLTLFFGMLFTACQNNSAKQNEQPVEKASDSNITSEPAKDPRYDSAKKATSREYIFKSDNGEIIEASFFQVYDDKYVEVTREKKDGVVLKQIRASAKDSVYKSETYNWISEKDKASFTNGIFFLNLNLISPLKQTYTTGQEEITVIYFDKGDRRFVTIKRNEQPEVTLEQTTAWAKGAEYKKGTVQWRSERNRGTLTEEGKVIEFREKE